MTHSDQAKHYGVIPPVPGTAYSLPWKTYIPLGPKGASIDVIAHEWVHAEIATRLGYAYYTFALPAWFNEGAAMQVDDRKEKIWRLIQEGAALPPVSSIRSNRDFYAGDRARHYAASKVEVGAWLKSRSNRGLFAFLEALSEGEGFDESYRRHGLPAPRHSD